MAPLAHKLSMASADRRRASSSSSTSARPWAYEVFLSFRGEDTRHNFTDHLYASLWRKGIRTFRDDEELSWGREIGSSLFDAIEESRFVLVILSKNYASSKWCLKELEKIMECKEEMGKNSFSSFLSCESFRCAKSGGELWRSVGQSWKKNSSGVYTEVESSFEGSGQSFWMAYTEWVNIACSIRIIFCKYPFIFLYIMINQKSTRIYNQHMHLILKNKVISYIMQLKLWS